MARKSDINNQDLDVLYDLVFENLNEDRKSLMEVYTHLKKYITDMPDPRYSESGDTLAKYAEVLVKQTAQIVELIRIAKKEKHVEEGENLDEVEMEVVHEEIKKQ